MPVATRHLKFRLILLYALISLPFGCGALVAAPDRQDISKMASSEITALQTRLKDDGCYAGPINGQNTKGTREAINNCPDQRPQLRIETGMHTAVIKRIGVDADCNVAATASDDKTVRLWSLPNGLLLRVLRGPIGAGDDGKVFATAVSPDGRFVAAQGMNAAYDEAGDSGHVVSIFDATTGSVVARLGNFEMSIDHLAFSKDGRWLAATLGASAGVEMFDVSTWRAVAADKDYEGDSYGAVFGPDGRLYTTSYDGKIRRYGPGPSFRKEREIATRGGKRPFAIDIDLEGSRLAVGFNDSASVDFYEASTLDYRFQAQTQGGDNGPFISVAARADGRAWLAGGGYWNEGFISGLLFGHDGHLLRQPLPLSKTTIMDLKTCGNGFALAAGDPAFGLLDASGSKRLWHEGVAADLRDKVGEAFKVSADAKKVRFGLGFGGETPVMFDLTKATLSASAILPPGLITAKTTGLRITDWRNTDRPQLAGRAFLFDRDGATRALAVRPGNDGFVLGADFWLQSFDARGEKRWWDDVPGAAWGVNMSADGRIVVVAYGDGTIRWHRWSDGRELLALFVNKLTQAWVAWTPSGYYMASPGGEDMIGWHVNRGWAQAADFFPASKFRDQFSRPDVVEKVLDTLDESQAVQQANAARGGKVAPPTPLLERLPPVIVILSPTEGAIVGDEVRVDYLVRSPSNLPVEAVETLVDGRPMSGSRGLTRLSRDNGLRECLGETRGLGRIDGALQGCHGSLTISIPKGAHEIGMFARSGDRVSDVVKIAIVRKTASIASAQLAKPNLYALVVGISTYANSNYALQFAAKDARDFAAALVNQKGGLYGNVTVRLLADQDASATGIKDGLDWLTKQVSAQDVGLVYLAGHGVVDERDRFYFVAADSDADRIRATGVPREDIQDALDALPGKALLFLDACHSGAVGSSKVRGQKIDVNGVANAFTQAEHGVVMFTASTGRQESQENTEWGNGAFTKAVIEGLGAPGGHAKADFLGKGTITTSALDTYVSARVKDLTGGGQSPVMIRPATVPDFPLAMAR